MGGDFNLIRYEEDKSSGHGDQRLIFLFNDFIGRLGLREIARTGARYTRTNKQLNPIMSNIDRVLSSTTWEQKYPLSILSSLTRVGSGHYPILIINGDDQGRKPRQFLFEKQWLKQEGFRKLVADPLSPMLFNLAVDALDHILNKAKQHGHIRGVIPHLVSRGGGG